MYAIRSYYGFHPELTGKENIFLNGAILGMTKSEIKKKLDEIVEFAVITSYSIHYTKLYDLVHSGLALFSLFLCLLLIGQVMVSVFIWDMKQFLLLGLLLLVC